MEIQYLFKISYESFIETLYRGDQLAFKYNDKYYFIEGNSFDNEEKGRVGNYYIVDPGIDNQRLEMLFLLPEERGKGLGKQLLQYGIDNYGINELTVNKQN